MSSQIHPITRAWDRQGAAQQLALTRALCSVQSAARITDNLRAQGEAAHGHPRADLPAMICTADYCVQPTDIWGEGMIPPCHLCQHFRPRTLQLEDPVLP